MNLCKHCAIRNVTRSRGLCYGCYDQREIRELYPPKCVNTYACPSREGSTMEELDAMIAEQMQHLPDWWWDEHEKEDDGKELSDKTLRCRTMSKRLAKMVIGTIH